jgi:sulfoxide reductase heme-binding subunit YedZ
MRARAGGLPVWVKPAVFTACLLPLAWALGEGITVGLGTNPIEEITHRSGDWTLRFLLITLCVSPLRWLTGWTALLRLRRMLGLFAFFYATLHLFTYLWLDQFFLWGEIAADIVKRPFITVGMAAFVILLALAATSTQGAVRRLGRRWVTLHRGVYIAAILGVVHFWWLVKFDVREPALYAVLLTVLLLGRVMRAGWRRWGPDAAPSARAASATRAGSAAST